MRSHDRISDEDFEQQEEHALNTLMALTIVIAMLSGFWWGIAEAYIHRSAIYNGAQDLLRALVGGM